MPALTYDVETWTTTKMIKEVYIRKENPSQNVWSVEGGRAVAEEMQ